MFRQAWRLSRLSSLLGVGLMVAILAEAAQAQQGAKIATGAAEKAKAAEIILYVPTGAEIWFNDDKTSQSGPVWVYKTPPLPPGRDFSYQLRVRWKEGESTVERNHPLTFRAGDEITLHFTKPQPTRKWVYYHVPSGTAWGSPPDWSNTGSVNAANWRVVPASDGITTYQEGPPPPAFDTRSWTSPNEFDSFR
jgi:uncharacterized protein (TIGR03000 family)